MSKSLYSISLSDEVVDAIDRLAKLSGTNRSALINQILAERISFRTPEQQIRLLYADIAQCMKAFLPEFKLPSDETRDGAYTVVTALKYKYNPSIRYSVVLYTDDADYIGKIRIILRTQNERLLDDFENFCLGWRQLEGAKPSEAMISRGTYSRLVSKPDIPCANEDIANAVSDYVNVINKCCQIYMDDFISGKEKSSQISRLYENYKNRKVYTV